MKTFNKFVYISGHQHTILILPSHLIVQIKMKIEKKTKKYSGTHAHST